MNWFEELFLAWQALFSYPAQKALEKERERERLFPPTSEECDEWEQHEMAACGSIAHLQQPEAKEIKVADMIGEYRISETDNRVYITNEYTNQHISIPRETWLAMCQPSVIQTRIGSSPKEPNRGRHFYEVYTWGEHVPADDPRHEQLSWEGLKDHVKARWNAVYDEARVGRCGYNQFEPDNGTYELLESDALEGINLIRNSIIGAQTFNWSEHMYPLVSLLDRAGYEGLPYPEAKANIGTLIDRNRALVAAIEIAWGFAHGPTHNCEKSNCMIPPCPTLRAALEEESK